MNTVCGITYEKDPVLPAFPGFMELASFACTEETSLGSTILSVPQKFFLLSSEGGR